MRSVYLILGCCLMFAAVMVMGVSMQSCKSKRAMEKSVQTDYSSMTAYKEELDSFAFRRLLERYNKNWTLEVRHYRPVVDSTCKVTDTYQDIRMNLTYQQARDRDHSDWDIVFREEGDSTNVTASEESGEKEEPAPKDYKIFLYMVLVILVVLWVKK